jgi:hypothetical protein
VLLTDEIAARTIDGCGSQRSWATTVAMTSTILWLGGHSSAGVSCTVIVGGFVSWIVTLVFAVSLRSIGSVTVSVAPQTTGHGGGPFTLRVGVALLASSIAAPGQSDCHSNVIGSPSGSNDAEPSSCTAVTGPWHSST